MALTTSILRGGTNSHETTSEEANGVYTDFVSEGVLGTIANTSGVAPATGAYAVNAQGTPDMTVAVTAGTAYVTATPSTQGSQTFRVVSSAEEDVTISANSSGSTKYDWVYLKLDATLLNAPNVAGTDAATLVTSRSSSISTDDGTPPTYSILLAIVTVSNGAATITNGNIKDLRERTSIGASTTDSTGWLSLGATPGTVTALGNRSYTLLFDNTDLTDTVSEGMRLRTTRTVSAPTQCADLEAGSSQYFNKTTPNKLTFTDDFVCSAWVRLESYGALTAIVSRYNGTSGFTFRANASGQLDLIGYNAGAVNNSYITSYQSIPLNKWVHVAAQLDMSAFTATTTTSYIMIDGVDVPAFVTRGGTNPTALVQAGNLEVGGTNGGTAPFDGKIAQVAVFNAKVTQATMKTYISQGLTGTETSLASAYSLSNSITDLNTTTPNDLTAQGSALATNVDSPFGNYLGGTLDYAIITKTAFSANTTLTVQVPEGCTIPTSGGVSAVAYSTQAVPYGFPRDTGRWAVEAVYITPATPAATLATWYNNNSATLTVPSGSFILGYKGQLYAFAGAATTGSNVTNLSYTAANSTPVTGALTTATNVTTPGANTSSVIPFFVEDFVSLSVGTPVYANVYSSTSISALGWYTFATSSGARTLTIFAKPAYL